mmetsp:Transcript_46459/g.123294  ORF Transcript_46459/g.123294 Transcript_46459/m.123294 type:complete len:210 (-) Transcript_46459:324-953(-)
MGTNSIFMHQMTSKDAQMNLEMKRSQPAPSEPVGPGGAGADSSWVGTNSVFFGSNGGGYGWARAPTQKIMKGQALRSIDKSKSVYRDGYSSNTIQSVPVLGGTNAAFNLADGYHYGWAKKPQSPKTNRVQKSHLQSLFRSADAHEAEYGREGDNQVEDDCLCFRVFSNQTSRLFGVPRLLVCLGNHASWSVERRRSPLRRRHWRPRHRC